MAKNLAKDAGKDAIKETWLVEGTSFFDFKKVMPTGHHRSIHGGANMGNS